MLKETAKIGRHGTIVIPSALRKRFGLHDGDLVITEDHGDGVLIRPAVALPEENYDIERQAEFLLTNAIDHDDYKQAREAVKEMGLNPDKIKHQKPNSKP